MKGRSLAFAGALAIVVAAGVSPIASRSVRADTPSGPYSVTPQSPATYMNTTGVFGWPDPNGPPAVPCNSTMCDRQTVNFGAGTSPVTDTFSLTVTVTFASTDTTLGNCLDLAIEDSTATTVFAKQSCAGTGGSVTDPNVAPGTAYTVEIDADAANGVISPLTPQTFTATVTGGASVPVLPTPTPIPANPFTFTHQVSVDIQHGDGEPDLAIANDNQNMYASTPYGFSTTVSLMWKSLDGGVQWDNLHGSAAGDTPPCPNPTAVALRPDCSRGGGDSEIQLSAPQGGSQQTVQFEDLNGLDTISCAYSTDGGDTFVDLPGSLTLGNPTAGTACNDGSTANASNCSTALPKPNPPCATLGTDRQWVQVWPAADNGTANDKLYMIFDTGDQPPSGDASMHADWTGTTWQWTLGCSTVGGSSCVGGPNGAGSRPGPLVINPTLINTVAAAPGITGGRYPTLYEFMGTNSNGTEVNISCDGGQSWSNIATSNGQVGGTTNDFVAGAMDQHGELYTAYTVANDPNPWRVWFAHSTGSGSVPAGSDCSVPVQGTTWSTPVALTGPPSSADSVAATPIPGQSYAVMPWLTAGSNTNGSNGRIDLVYYGTSQAVPFNPDSQAATWYMHMAQSLDGGSTWTDEPATETPMHVKSICFSGIGCTAQTPPGGDRNLLDFFQVKLDSSGRAVIIYTDDNNTAACASTCSPGIGLISSVQQATGPSLFGPGAVPPLTSGLSQSLDVRQAGVNADVTDADAPNDAVLPAPGHNIQGPDVPALDISDLKVCTVASVACPVTNTSPNHLSFLFTLNSLSGGLSSAVTGAHTEANWLVTWRWNNDVWFAQATTGAAGSLSCAAGRPLSVFNDGEPKAVEYTTAGNSEATGLSAAECKTTGNQIEIDVPLNGAVLGSLGTAGDTTNHELYGLTGWTGNGNGPGALSSSVCGVGTSPVDNCHGNLGFFDNADETAPLDVLVTGTPGTRTPESPAVPLLVGLGVIALGAGAYVRRRRAAARAPQG
jgi:hypothetical protein